MKTLALNDSRIEQEISQIEKFWACEAPETYPGWSWMKVPEFALDEIDSYHRLARLKLGAEPVDWDSSYSSLGVQGAIDGHSHLEGYPETPGLVQELEEILDRAQIQHIVTLPLYKFWDDFFREVDQWLSGPLADRVVPFAGLDWKLDQPGFVEKACAHLEKCRTKGVRGLKVHNNVGLAVTTNGKVAPLTDTRYKEIFSHAGELGFPVWIHYGDPFDFFFPLEGNARKRELTCFPDWQWYSKNFGEKEYWKLHEDFFRMIEEVKGTNFNAVHLANYHWERIDEFARLLANYPNLYSDISGRMAEIGKGKTLDARESRTEAARRLFTSCQDKILWGTDILPTEKLYKLWSIFLRSDTKDVDYTWATFYPGQGDWLVDSLGLEAEILNKLCRDVAKGLLGL
jgi:predicted TIM-barrel fold metal-dependent hydrolase